LDGTLVTGYKAWLNVKPPFSVKSFLWSIAHQYSDNKEKNVSQNADLFAFQLSDTAGGLRVLLHSVTVKGAHYVSKVKFNRI
jgi:hypothetical protein